MSAFSSNEKLNIAYKLFYQIAGSANDAPGQQYWYNEQLAWSPILPLNKLWVNFYNIQSAVTSAQADANTLVNTDIQKVKVRLTVISTSNNRGYLTKTGATILDNWIQPSLIRTSDGSSSNGYGVSLWNGDPDTTGVELDTTYHSDAGDPSWTFNYSTGLVLISTSESTHYKSLSDLNGLYLVGYRYVGATGLTQSAVTYLGDLLDVRISGLTSGQTLMYSGGSWINSSAVVDLSPYYTALQTDVLLSNLYNSLTGKSSLSQLTDVSSAITLATDGQALVWNVSENRWVASGITVDMSLYYTISQVNSLFYNSAQTDLLYSPSGHSHYLTGLTDVSPVMAVDGQFLQFSAGTWNAVDAAGLSGFFVSKSGDTMYGNLVFNFMSGLTNRLLYVDSGGTVLNGEEIESLYLSGVSLIGYIQDENNWSGSTFIGLNLSAYTIYEGQRYIDSNYFYEYLDGILYRTYYSRADHNHDTLYYTQTQLLIVGVLDSRYLTASALTFLVDLADVSLTVSALTNNSYLRFNLVNQKWQQFDFNINDYALAANTVPSTRQVNTVGVLNGGGALSSNLTIAHNYLTATTSSVAPSGVVVVGMVFDGYGHVNSYQTANINSLLKTQLNQLDDVSIGSILNNQALIYDGGSSRWKNKFILKSYISDFVESAYTHTFGNETIAGNKTFTGIVTVNDLTLNNSLFVGGNLYVAGTATTIYTADLVIKDKIITINSGQSAGYGVQGGVAGIEIKRGFYPDYLIVFDEESINYSGGTLRIGISGATQAVAMREDSPIPGGIGYWDVEHTRFDTSSNLIFSGDTVYLNGTLIANLVITATTINAELINTAALTLSSATNTQILFVSGNTVVGNNNLIFSNDTLYTININAKSLTLSSGVTALYIQGSTGVTDSATTLLTEQSIVEYVKANGGGSVAGNTYEVQFNSGGSFKADSKFVYYPQSNTLRVSSGYMTSDSLNSFMISNGGTITTSTDVAMLASNIVTITESKDSAAIGVLYGTISWSSGSTLIGVKSGTHTTTEYSSVISALSGSITQSTASTILAAGGSISSSNYAAIIATRFGSISTSTGSAIIGGSGINSISYLNNVIALGLTGISLSNSNSSGDTVYMLNAKVFNNLYADSIGLVSGVMAKYIQNSTGVTDSATTILTEQAIVEYVKANGGVVGNDTEIQFNSGGTFGALPSFAYAYNAGNNFRVGFTGNFYGAYNAVIAGTGHDMSSGGAYSAILGGQGNFNWSNSSAVIGGNGNENVWSLYGVILGGEKNALSAEGSTILGGYKNQLASSSFASILGGELNKIKATSANSTRSIIIGGIGNTIDSFENVTIISCSALTAVSANTVYVPALDVQDEITLATAGKGIIVVSPLGNRYRITVDDMGNLVSTLI